MMYALLRKTPRLPNVRLQFKSVRQVEPSAAVFLLLLTRTDDLR